MQRSERYPDAGRADAGAAVSNEWSGGRERAAALVAARSELPWPAGLLSWSVYVDADGDLVRDYALWERPPAQPDELAPDELPLDDLALDELGGRDRVIYRLYRGGRRGAVEPGAAVFVRVDTRDADLARTWIDAVFAALAGDTDPPAGGIGGFFHISTDGTHVLNYAEWESAEAHRRALAATGGVSISSGALWDRVRTMPGVRQVSVARYQLYATLTRE